MANELGYLMRIKFQQAVVVLLSIGILFSSCEKEEPILDEKPKTYTVSKLAGSEIFLGGGGVTVQDDGTIFLAEPFLNRIYKITSNGEVSIYFDGKEGYFDFRDIVSDKKGNFFASDGKKRVIRKISSSGELSIYAGSGEQGTEDGPALEAQFTYPVGLAIGHEGTLYVADAGSHRIRKIDTNGTVTTLAGSVRGYADGKGENAKFYQPYGLTIDRQGNIFVADQLNNRIRKITPTGDVSTLAGRDEGTLADGKGQQAAFWRPWGLVLDSWDNLYVTDQYNNCVRKIAPNGEVVTVAGGTAGTLDGEGSQAEFLGPTGIAIDRNGNLYVSDGLPNGLRKITVEEVKN